MKFSELMTVINSLGILQLPEFWPTNDYKMCSRLSFRHFDEATHLDYKFEFSALTTKKYNTILTIRTDWSVLCQTVLIQISPNSVVINISQRLLTLRAFHYFCRKLCKFIMRAKQVNIFHEHNFFPLYLPSGLRHRL